MFLAVDTAGSDNNYSSNRITTDTETSEVWTTEANPEDYGGLWEEVVAVYSYCTLFGQRKVQLYNDNHNDDDIPLENDKQVIWSDSVNWRTSQAMTIATTAGWRVVTLQ